MITILFFLLFYFFLYFVGKGLFLAIKSKINTFFEIPIFYFYPIFALFYIGNFTIILNFFFKISYLTALILVLPPLLISIKNHTGFTIHNFSFRNILSFLITPVLLGVSSFDINFSYDAALYHLNHQNWIRNSKIIFGLVNNHGRFGYSSIMEYINANFWINDNFLILHFVNLIFIVFIFQIMYHFLFTKYYKFSLIFLFYGLLDNFGFGGGKNGFIEIDSIAKQDAPFAVLFLLSSILLYLYINKVFTNTDNQDIVLLFIIVLFSVQMRPLGAINLIGFLAITFYKFRFKKSLLFIFKKGFMVTILGIFFMIKNIIISNCLIYPIDFLCSNSMPWGSISDFADAKREREDLANFHVSLTSENFTTWFANWSTKETNLQVFQNIVLTFVIILLTLIVVTIFNKEKFSPKNKSWYLFYCIVTLLLWLLTAPGIRLGVGVFLTCFMLLGAVREPKLPGVLFERNFIALSIFYIIVVAMVPRISSYSAAERFLFDDSLRTISPLIVDYIDNEEGYGVIPQVGDQCWINLECVRNKKVIKDKFYSYINFKDE
jgi:hypothetical protein